MIGPDASTIAFLAPWLAVLAGGAVYTVIFACWIGHEDDDESDPPDPQETNMNDWKSMLASRTVWAALVAVAAGVAQAFGYAIGLEDQATLVDKITGAGAIIGGLGAIWGRIVASKKIGVAK